MSSTGTTSASNMSHKRVFNEFVADDSPTAPPNSKRSKIPETANKNDSTATPNEGQLKAPGMNIQPLNHIDELNYRSAATSFPPVNSVVAFAQMPPPTASSNELRNTAAVAQPVGTSAGQRPVRCQATKKNRPAATPAMQNPAPPQPPGISHARLDSPLGLFNQQPFWDTPRECEMHLERMRGHDEMIRHFIWLLAPHDVQTSSASPEAQSRACGVHYDCIMRFLSTPYSASGLRVQAYSWDDKPTDEMLLQQLEAETYITVNRFGVSRTDAKGVALCRQEHFFLLATSFVFISIMKLLIHRSRRGLLVDHIDAQAWSWARNRSQLDLENEEKEHWPSKHTGNFFVRLMAMAIQDMTISNIPANCSGFESLQWCLYNAVLVSESLEQDTQAINAVEGISINGPLHLSIEKMLEPINADLQRQVGRRRAEQAAQAAHAVLIARAQRQAQMQAQHRAAQRQQVFHQPPSQVQYQAAQQPQRVFTKHVSVQEDAASVSQPAQGRVQPFAPTSALPLTPFSQHGSCSETVSRSASSTPASWSQPVLQESTAPRKRKRSGDEAVDADEGSVSKKFRYDWHHLPSSNFADTEVARPTRVVPVENVDSTQTAFEDNSGQSRLEKLESQQTNANRQPPVSPGVASFTEFLNSKDFDDRYMDELFDFSAASSDDNSNTGSSKGGFLATNDTPLDGSNVGILPGQPVGTGQFTDQNNNPSQPIPPVHDILTSHNGSKMVSPKGPALTPPDDDEFMALLETLKNDSFRPLQIQDASLMPRVALTSPRASRSNSDTSHLSNDELLGLIDDTLKQTRDII